MKTSTKIDRKNRWVSISLVIALTVGMLSLSQSSLSAQPQNDDKNNELEAELLHDIDQWLEDAPISFEEETVAKIESEMDAKAKELRAYEARLIAQIEMLERIEGFRSDAKKHAKKEEITVLPTDIL